LEHVEEEMKKIIGEDLDIEREHLNRDEAKEFYSDNEYKTEILEDEAAGEDPVSFYRQGEFLDLCKGPHVDSTGDIGAFKLLEVAGAYWRGNEENEQLTRVYGTAFPSQKELEEFMERRRKAEERDHRKIGQEMDPVLYTGALTRMCTLPPCWHEHEEGVGGLHKAEERGAGIRGGSDTRTKSERALGGIRAPRLLR
jgi:threonyl-tRNA synthetase (EC 6.1.1.3)/Ser-tRNA(Thr) hydrolase (EC 3.1.1.-)